MIDAEEIGVLAVERRCVVAAVVRGRDQHPRVVAQLVVGVDERRLIGEDDVVLNRRHGPIRHGYRYDLITRGPQQDPQIHRDPESRIRGRRPRGDIGRFRSEQPQCRVNGVAAVVPEEVVCPTATATRPADVLPLVEQVAADHGAWSHFAAGDHPSCLDERGGVALGVADHQPQSRSLGQVDQAIGLGQRRGKWDFTEDVLTGEQRALRLLRVSIGRRADDDRLNAGIRRAAGPNQSWPGRRQTHRRRHASGPATGP